MMTTPTLGQVQIAVAVNLYHGRNADDGAVDAAASRDRKRALAAMVKDNLVMATPAGNMALTDDGLQALAATLPHSTGLDTHAALAIGVTHLRRARDIAQKWIGEVSGYLQHNYDAAGDLAELDTLIAQMGARLSANGRP